VIRQSLISFEKAAVRCRPPAQGRHHRPRFGRQRVSECGSAKPDGSYILETPPIFCGRPLYFAGGSYISRTARRQNIGLTVFSGALPKTRTGCRKRGRLLYFADGSSAKYRARRICRRALAGADGLSETRTAPIFCGRPLYFADGLYILRTARRQNIGAAGRFGEPPAKSVSRRDHRHAVREGEEPSCGAMRRRSCGGLVREIQGAPFLPASRRLGR
jgi:hypothetical protein